jgi:tRNA pseudouridine38-40 synthase
LSTETRRLKLVVSYDGSDFRGWAAQTGQRTVQSTLKEAVRRATGEETEPVGASRTDSGAHALGQVAHIDLSVPIPVERVAGALNRLLPTDLRIRSAEEVDETFHSRFCATYRHYRYRILHDPTDPFLARYAHLYDRELDLEKMADAAQFLVGEHDFEAFTEELDPDVENTVRTLHKIEVSRREGCTEIDVEGTAFLRGMMRRISGFLVEVGRGHRPAEDARVLLGENRHQTQWPVVLPARGLCLRYIHYETPYVDSRLKAT